MSNNAPQANNLNPHNRGKPYRRPKLPSQLRILLYTMLSLLLRPKQHSTNTKVRTQTLLLYKYTLPQSLPHLHWRKVKTQKRYPNSKTKQQNRSNQKYYKLSKLRLLRRRHNTFKHNHKRQQRRQQRYPRHTRPLHRNRQLKLTSQPNKPTLHANRPMQTMQRTTICHKRQLQHRQRAPIQPRL